MCPSLPQSSFWKCGMMHCLILYLSKLLYAICFCRRLDAVGEGRRQICRRFLRFLSRNALLFIEPAGHQVWSRARDWSARESTPNFFVRDSSELDSFPPSPRNRWDALNWKLFAMDSRSNTVNLFQQLFNSQSTKVHPGLKQKPLNTYLFDPVWLSCITFSWLVGWFFCIKPPSWSQRKLAEKQGLGFHE